MFDDAEDDTNGQDDVALTRHAYDCRAAQAKLHEGTAQRIADRNAAVRMAKEIEARYTAYARTLTWVTVGRSR